MQRILLSSTLALLLATPIRAAMPAEGPGQLAEVPGVEVFRVTQRPYDAAEPEAVPGADQLVTMVVKDADVASVLQLLATQFKLNRLTTGDVKGQVTFQFTDVPLNTALDVLVKAAACNYVRAGDVLVVKSLKNEYAGELETRVFNLNYAEATDIQQAINKLVSNKGDIRISYRRVGEGGKSKRSSVLLVTDYPVYLANIERVIQELDQPVPQVSIEAKFIETTLNSSDLYGIDWQITAGVNAKSSPVPPFRPGSDVTLPLVLNGLNIGTLNLGQLSAVLNILQSRGNGRLLANPRAVTLDNQTAEMTIATRVPLREVRIDPGTQAQTVTWRQQNIPVGLSVTPHVLPDGTIDMEINPEVEAITGYVGTPGDQQPITSRREARTQIRVRDGEVAVIGGLVQEELVQTMKKVPVLGDIPLLGLLFRHKSVTSSKTDLLIFIIPHILPAL
ncbi:MAG: secretin N-terminal domain-containing protein [candidate division WOR-3 bacterium]